MITHRTCLICRFRNESLLNSLQLSWPMLQKIVPSFYKLRASFRSFDILNIIQKNPLSQWIHKANHRMGIQSTLNQDITEQRPTLYSDAPSAFWCRIPLPWSSDGQTASRLSTILLQTHSGCMYSAKYDFTILIEQ